MQTPAALTRVAYEAVADLAADGVVYAELRFAPLLHTGRGMTPYAVMAAVSEGIAAGASDSGMMVGLIVDALRDRPDSAAVADLAVAWMDRGVVAFDLAGPEAGYPADDHLAACRRVKERNLGLTLHAGEGDGPNSVWRALARCGATRIGHGVRIVEDTTVVDGEIVAVGRVARMVRDHRIPLEVCISSNVHTGAFPSAAAHPLGMLYRAGFNVTINTDNRLMSGILPTDEFALAVEHHGFGPSDLLAVTENALRAGFGDWQQRRRLLEDVVRPAYREAGAGP
jgi:adenosine deaminase